ncbi:MAG: right-handed parallel beta-helix repeat-containing protein [archaeon]|nr:right-handed parallel beta-helix repeat-containing protein [archaeon]
MPYNSSGNIRIGGDYYPLVRVLNCNDAITSNLSMEDNLDCPGTNGLVIGANTISINCNGYNITGNGSGIGLRLSSYSNVKIWNCTLSGFSTGLLLESASQNNITLNMIINNSIGINASNSNNNLIYNNFFNNTNNAYDDAGNKWSIDNLAPEQNIVGEPFIGGNFWNDYAGSDDGSGSYPPYNESDDGIGDTQIPYTSGGDIQLTGDYFPLVDTIKGSDLNNTNLTQDLLKCRGNCLYVRHSNVVIDCKGKRIAGYGSGAGISVDSGKPGSSRDITNVVIKNCIIDNFDNAIVIRSRADAKAHASCHLGPITWGSGRRHSWAIDVHNVQIINTTLKNLDSDAIKIVSDADYDKDCTDCLGGLWEECDTQQADADVTDSTIANVNVSSASGRGVYLEGAYDHGAAYVLDTDIINNSFSNIGTDGIRADDQYISDITIRNNTIVSAGSSGIYLSDVGGSVALTKNKIRSGCNSFGMYLDIGSPTITESLVEGCTGTGIYVLGSGAVLEDVNSSASASGGSGIYITGGSNNLKNVSTFNSGYYGIYLGGSGNTLRDIKVNRTGNTGIYLNGGSNTLSRITVNATEGEGIQIFGDGNNLDYISVRLPRGDGIDLRGSSSTLDHLNLRGGGLSWGYTEDDKNIPIKVTSSQANALNLTGDYNSVNNCTIDGVSACEYFNGNRCTNIGIFLGPNSDHNTFTNIHNVSSTGPNIYFDSGANYNRVINATLSYSSTGSYSAIGLYGASYNSFINISGPRRGAQYGYVPAAYFLRDSSHNNITANDFEFSAVPYVEAAISLIGSSNYNNISNTSINSNVYYTTSSNAGVLMRRGASNNAIQNNFISGYPGGGSVHTSSYPSFWGFYTWGIAIDGYDTNAASNLIAYNILNASSLMLAGQNSRIIGNNISNGGQIWMYSGYQAGQQPNHAIIDGNLINHSFSHQGGEWYISRTGYGIETEVYCDGGCVNYPYNLTIINNTIINCESGIGAPVESASRLINNRILNTSYWGVSFGNTGVANIANDNYIEFVNSSQSSLGMTVGTSGGIVYNNTVTLLYGSLDYYALQVEGNYNNISSNNITYNRAGYGLLVEGNYNNLTSNIVNNNTQHGIYAIGHHIKLRDNTAINNTAYSYFVTRGGYSEADTSNIGGQEGKPFLYVTSLADYTVQNTDAYSEIEFADVKNSTINNVTINNPSTTSDGIVLVDTINVSVLNSNLNYNYLGVFAANSNYSNITNNDVGYNKNRSIAVSSCGNFLVDSNDVYYDLGSKAIEIQWSVNGTLSNNNVSHISNLSGSKQGIYVYGGSNITLIWNIVKDINSSNSVHGIYLTSQNSSIKNNVLSNVTGDYSTYAIYCTGDNARIIENDAEDISNGIYYSGARGNVSYNSITINNFVWLPNPTGTGIYLSGSNNNLTFNEIVNSREGIYASGSNQTLSYNNITNSSIGIHFSASSSKILSNRISSSITNGSGSFLSGTGIYTPASSTIIQNNTIVDSANAGIYFYSATNNNVTNNTFVGNNVSIRLDSSSNNNRVYYNSFYNSSTVHVFSPYPTTSTFNTTVAGAAQGNYWDDIFENELKILDITEDGFGDAGLQYPYSAAKGAQVSANVFDWGPIVTVLSGNITTTLSVWDETDALGGSRTRYPTQQVKFFASYLNSSLGLLLNASCRIDFADLNDSMSMRTANNVSISRVENYYYTGQYSSLDLDSNNSPHIAYYDGNNYYLKYAKWNGTGWNISTVDNTYNSGQYASLALDSNNYPHISYYYGSYYALRYAKWNGTFWNISYVSGIYSGGQYSSLALDSNNSPHIAYYDNYNSPYGLRYAKWNGTGWNITKIVNSSAVSYISLALDSSNNAHISYYNSTFPYSMQYAKWNGTGWNVSTVDSGYVGQYTSIALDSDNYPHISYFNNSANSLRYAKWNGTSWNVSTVDSGYVGQYTSIAIDSGDKPHITYYNNTGYPYFGLKYARWTGSAWDISTIESSNTGQQIGQYSSVKIDSNGRVHVSYYNASYPNGLKYAFVIPKDDYYTFNRTFSSPGTFSWNATCNKTDVVVAQNYTGNMLLDNYLIDYTDYYNATYGGVYVGEGNTIDLDENDNPAVAYWTYIIVSPTPEYTTIQYAKWNGTEWKKTNISSSNTYFNGMLGLPRESIVSLTPNNDNDSAILYTHESQHLVARWNYTGNSWYFVNTSTVSSVLGDLHMDSNSNPIAAATYSSSIGYWGWNGTTYNFTLADRCDIDCSSPAMDLDSQNRTYFLYYYTEPNPNIFTMRYWNGSAWVSNNITEAINGVHGPYDLVIDSTGKPHVAFVDKGPNTLNYAVWNGTSWNITAISSEYSGSSKIMIVVDDYDRPYILHTSPTGLNLMYYNGIRWSNQTVKPYIDAYMDAEVAVDSQNISHVVYHDTGELGHVRGLAYARILFNETIKYYNKSIYYDVGIANDTVNISNIVRFASPANTTYLAGNISINIWNASLAQSVWWFNGSENLTYTSPLVHNFTDGSHLIYAYANDSSGSVYSANVTFSVISETLSVIITSPENGTITNISAQNFSINISSVSGLGNATLRIFNLSGLYNETFFDLTGLFQTSVGVVIWLADGVYNWFWEVYDIVNTFVSTQETVGNYTITEDTIAPSIAINSPQAIVYYNASILVNIGASDLHLDSIWWNNGTADINYTNASYYGFGNGTWTIYAYANDSAGNVNSTNVTFDVDLSPPIVHNIAPPNNTVSNNLTQTFVCNITSNGGIDYINLIIRNVTNNITYDSTMNNVLPFNVAWNKTLGYQFDDSTTNIALDSSGNVYVSGRMYNSTSTYNMMWLIKYNSTGDLEWEKTYGDELSNIGLSISPFDDIYLAGYYYGAYYTRLFKYATNGTLLWSKTLGLQAVGSRTVAADSSGNVYLTDTNSSGTVAIKYNSSGSHLWNSSIIGGGGYAIAADAFGDIYMLSLLGMSKYNSSGSYVWNKSYSTNLGVWGASSVRIDSSGNVYTVGMITPTSDYDIAVSKFDSDGNQIWYRTTENITTGLNVERGGDLAIDSFGNVYVTGYSGTGGPSRLLLIKYDKNGGLLWNKTIQRSNVDAGSGIVLASDDVAYLTGTTSVSSFTDAWTMKLNLTVSQTRYLGGTSNSTSWNVTLPHRGNYTWICEGTDIYGRNGSCQEGNSTLIIASGPSISIITPINNEVVGWEVTFLANVTSDYLDDVWYEVRNESGVIASGFMDTSYIGGNTYNATLFTNESWPYDASAYNSTNLTFIVYANDTLGNTANASSLFVLENSNPAIQFIMPPETGIILNHDFNLHIHLGDFMLNYSSYNITNSSGQVVQFNATNISGQFFEWYDYVNVSLLAEGNYSVGVFVGDSNYNNNSKSSWFYLHLMPPNATDITPQNETITNITAINFTANLSDNFGLANATLYIYNETGLYNRTTIDLGGILQTSLGIVVWLADGVYNWFWEVFDIASNVLTTGNYTISEDTSNPVFTNLANISIYSNESVNYDLDATDTGSGVSCFGVNDTRFAITCSGVLTNLTDIAVGEYWITLSANDSAGNTVSGEARINVTLSAALDTEDPAYSNIIVTPGPPANYSETGQYRFNITWTDNAGIGSVIIEFNGVNTTISGVGGNYTFAISGLSAGNHPYRWFANDTAGNFAETPLFVYAVDKAAPALLINMTPSNSITSGTATSIEGLGCPSQLNCTLYRDNVSVSNPDNATLGVGSYIYLYNTTGNSNYTGAETSGTLTVSEQGCTDCGGCSDSTWTCAGWGACVGDVQTRTCVSNCNHVKTETKCCSVNWTCSEWTNCSFNRQERDCKSNCGTNETQTRVCEMCMPNWTCTDFGNCTSQGIMQRTCTDSNNCNTEAGKPDESIGCEYGRLCVPRIYCEDWGQCIYVDKVSDILQGTLSYTGYQERVCYDKNLCAENYTEYQNCTSGVELEMSKAEVCREDKLVAVNTRTNTPVTTINLESFKSNEIDVSFVQSYSVFCPHCYNGIQDAGEEGIDCGGECRLCKPESRIPWGIIAWALWIMAALLLVPILKLLKEDDDIIAEIRKLISDGKAALKENEKKRASEDYRRIRYLFIQIQSSRKREMIKKEIMRYFERIRKFYDFYVPPETKPIRS